MAPILVLGMSLSYGVLVTGIVTRRPDFEVLAWLMLGSELLLIVAGYEDSSYLLVAVGALAVVALADFEHSVAMLHPQGGEAIDGYQESARRDLLRRRAAKIGLVAGGSLTMTVLGVSLAPPLILSGESAAVVGVLAVVVILLVVLTVRLEH